MGRICFRPYERETLRMIIDHPDTARKNAFWLFTAYFWHRLKDELYRNEYDELEDDDDVPSYGEYDIEGVWIDPGLLSVMLRCSASDFMSAMMGGLTIRILNKPYRVPMNRGVTEDMLATRIFDFPDSVIMRDLINEGVEEQAKADDEQKSSRAYFRKIAYLTEVTDDGWTRLTDMEAAAYEWALEMCMYDGDEVRSRPAETLRALELICRDVRDFTIEELSECWTRPFGAAAVSVDSQFSASKIRKWNADNGQESCIDGVSQEDADDYWYSECSTFRKHEET